MNPIPVLSLPPDLAQQWYENAVRAEYREYLKDNPPDPLHTIAEAAKLMRIEADTLLRLIGKEYQYVDEDGNYQTREFKYESSGEKKGYVVRQSEMDAYTKRHQRKGRRR